MPIHMRLDDQDKRALRKLDHDFTFDAAGEVATVTGEMEVRVARLPDDRFKLTIQFPGGEELVVRVARSQLLQELEIEADGSE